MLSVKIIQKPDFAAIAKQIDFGTATGLTKTAKQGQDAVVASLKSTFTLRGNWFEQRNRFGIKVTPATKYSLKSEVKTAADWLESHEEGGTKHGDHRLAVPTDQVRRNKRLIIPRGQRPKGLAGKAFVLHTKKGDVIAQRLTRGKRKGLIILYGLERTVKVKKQSTFYEPIGKVVKAHLNENIRQGIAKAFATAR